MSDEKLTIPFWKKYVLSIEEAAQYFRIGETKLRALVNDNRGAKWILYIGNRAYIKRTLFENYVDELCTIS